MLYATTPLVDPQVILGVITATSVVLGGAGLWNWLIARRKHTIDAETAEASAADQLVASALAIAKDARESAQAADKSAQHSADELKTVLLELSGMRTHMRHQDERFDRIFAWARHLVDNWSTVRLNPDPPVMPVTEIIHHHPKEG